LPCRCLSADVALCPERDITRQGETIEAGRRSLHEALEFLVETADPNDVACRRQNEIRLGTRPSIIRLSGLLKDLLEQCRPAGHAP
jgi:hypothetical protein